MRFHDCEAPRVMADWQRVRDRWRSVGWCEVPAADEPAIVAAWSTHLQPSDTIQIPHPSRTWTLPDLSDEIEAEFSLKLLAWIPTRGLGLNKTSWEAAVHPWNLGDSP